MVRPTLIEETAYLQLDAFVGKKEVDERSLGVRERIDQSQTKEDESVNGLLNPLSLEKKVKFTDHHGPENDKLGEKRNGKGKEGGKGKGLGNGPSQLVWWRCVVLPIVLP